MSTPLRPFARRGAAVLAAVGLAACTQTGPLDEVGRDGEGADLSEAGTVPVPASRLTPFCQAMLDLDERLENDPPDDLAAAIIVAYEAIEEEVPEPLRPDFAAILAALRGTPATTTTSTTTTSTTTTSTTTTSTTVPATLGSAPDGTGPTPPEGDEFADEGRLPGDTPAERISNYVDSECRGVQNNPGPPATQPLEEPPTTDG